MLHRADEHGARFPLWQVVEGEVPPWTVVLRREAHACGLSDTALMQWLEADPDRIGSYALWSASSPLERVTAVVVDDLAESFVAAVTRMVLVGRGGIRLHAWSERSSPMKPTRKCSSPESVCRADAPWPRRRPSPPSTRRSTARR